MDFKKRIKERGLKIVWIAEKVGVSQPLLSMYLGGDRNMPEDVKNNLTELLR